MYAQYAYQIANEATSLRRFEYFWLRFETRNL